MPRKLGFRSSETAPTVSHVGGLYVRPLCSVRWGVSPTYGQLLRTSGYVTESRDTPLWVTQCGTEVWVSIRSGLEKTAQIGRTPRLERELPPRS